VADLSQAREWLAQADSVAVLTGAGISAEMACPRFAAAGGLWKDYKARRPGHARSLRGDPRWFGNGTIRAASIAKAQPNAAHRALSRSKSAKPRFTLITQNVDGLHGPGGQRTRFSKLHGDIWRMLCTRLRRQFSQSPRARFRNSASLRMWSMARPGVVWFGEPLAEGMMKEAEHAAGRRAKFSW